MKEKNKTIYLDYASTTPVDPRVAKRMMEFLTPDGEFGNPASRSHRYGWKADEAVEEARSHVANLVNCDPRETVWTSGATEADNLAVKGIAKFYKTKGNHIITSKIEHKAVLDPCRQLERDGFEVTYLEPNEGGIITPEAVNNAIHHGNKSNPNKMVNLSYEMVDGILTFEIEDEGPGFDYNHLPDPTHPQNIEKPHGRGVFLMKNLSHNLEFFNEGAKVRISFDCNTVVLE